MIHSLDRSVNGKDGDEASEAVDALPMANRAEVGALLEAWYCERGRSIEALLLLGRVDRLLSRAVARGQFTVRDESEVRRVLRAIAEIDEGHQAAAGGLPRARPGHEPQETRRPAADHDGVLGRTAAAATDHRPVRRAEHRVRA